MELGKLEKNWALRGEKGFYVIKWIAVVVVVKQSEAKEVVEKEGIVVCENCIIVQIGLSTATTEEEKDGEEIF